jgi:hypothetical protein
MPTPLQKHNGLLAKIWLLQCIDSLQNSSIDAFFDRFLNPIEPLAEVRDVAHQSLGPVKYFAIEFQDASGEHLYIRGYLNKDTLLCVKECSSSNLAFIDTHVFEKMIAALLDTIKKMPSNMPGQLGIKSHLNENPAQALDLQNVHDFHVLRDILMASSIKHAGELSHGLLDQFDLHPNLMEAQ